MRRLLQLAALVLALSALGARCDDIVRRDGPEGTGDVQVRIANRTGVDLARVRVEFPDVTVDYGDIGRNQSTRHRRVPSAYRYAYVEARLGSRRLVIQPIDYVGESLLPAGRYTYVLLFREDGFFDLELRRD